MFFTKSHFVLIDIIVVILLYICVFNGWKNGGKRSLLDLVSSVGKIVVSGYGSYALVHVFNPIPVEPVTQFLQELIRGNLGSQAPVNTSEESARFFCAVLAIIIYFVIFMSILSFAEKKIMKRKPKEEKKDSTADRILGAVLGFVLFLVCSFIPSSLFITIDAYDPSYSTKDLVNKTFLTVPFNYVIKPVVKLTAGEEFTEAFWKEGFLFLREDLHNLGQMWTEKQNSDKE